MQAKGKKAKTVKAWGIKHLPSNEIILPICPKYHDAERIMLDNFVNAYMYFKVVKVEIKEL